jgi:membrane protein required for colicin V production
VSILDIFLILIILFGAYGGYKEGLIVSLFSVIAIILGVLGGFKLMGNLMVILANKYNIDEKVLPYIAFGVVFIIIVIVVNLLGKLIKASITAPVLGVVDNVAGAILGVVRATFMLSIVFWIVDSLKIEFPDQWTANSWLHSKIAIFAPRLTHWIGKVFPAFGGIF